jgi:phosphoribosylglycinamide formyltransferase-1
MEPFAFLDKQGDSTLRPLRIAVGSSGSGGHLLNLINFSKFSKIIEIKSMFSDKLCGATEIALRNRIQVNIHKNLSLPLWRVIPPEIDVIVLAGYLKKVDAETVEKFNKRIINIHPSLLPKFGGIGNYGRVVHKQVLQSGEKKCGATVHYVDENYDSGEILGQIQVTIPLIISENILAKLVFELEKGLLQGALYYLALEMKNAY